MGFAIILIDALGLNIKEIKRWAMEIQIINHKSKWLKAVQNLGDTATVQLGSG